MPEINLPAVEQIELEMARSYLTFALNGRDLPGGDGLILLIARYGFLRQQNGGAFLRALASPDETKELTGEQKAFDSFHGEVCPGCEKNKKRANWVCGTCWENLGDLKRQLWRGFKVRDLPAYWQALAILKNERGAAIDG